MEGKIWLDKIFLFDTNTNSYQSIFDPNCTCIMGLISTQPSTDFELADDLVDEGDEIVQLFGVWILQ